MVTKGQETKNNDFPNNTILPLGDILEHVLKN